MTDTLHIETLASGATLTVYAPLPDSDRATVTVTDATGDVVWTAAVPAATWRESLELVAGIVPATVRKEHWATLEATNGWSYAKRGATYAEAMERTVAEALRHGADGVKRAYIYRAMVSGEGATATARCGMMHDRTTDAQRIVDAWARFGVPYGLE
jgi:hypothetical protein